ncbi:hypothetical protein QM012_008283 [Aureobasidium pullulans]|uniref:Uncharacterized protein n=1 Tax=Aureobasidium pullulans TaxID=5580 RepID=A0ABR0TK08_AURPU
MSDDEGEKFFLDYWQFDEHAFNSIEMDKALRARRSVSSAARLSNISNVEELLPPLLLHAESQPLIPIKRFLGRSLFERAYQCPTGTNSCESIGRICINRYNYHYPANSDCDYWGFMVDII